MKAYAHIDCNNFFVSCERLFRPDLEGKPVAVLSNNDSCVISRSAEVKSLGVAMAVPVFKIKNEIRANHITLFSANFELYGEMSERIVEILREITPLIEVYSIDECFLDLSELNITNLNTWAENVRDRLKKEVGMPVSVGVGGTKTLAKVATNHAKKHGGISVIDSDSRREAVLRQLPIADIWGVGYRTAPKLVDRGLTNAWQLINTSDAWLKKYFNVAGMRMISELRGQPQLAFGDKHDKRQSITVSRAFGHKVRAYHQLESAVASFVTRAAFRLRAQDSVCSTVEVYLTTGRYEDGSRSVSKKIHLPEASADTGVIIAAALGALEELYDSDFSYQKVAVTLLDIVNRQSWQLSLTDPAAQRDAKAGLMRRVDSLNSRYGLGTVWYAAEDKKHAKWQSRQLLRSPRYTTKWSELPTVGR